MSRERTLKNRIISIIPLYVSKECPAYYELKQAIEPRTFIPAVGTAPYTAGNGTLNDRKRRFIALIFTLFNGL